jgi:hypothetical protein
MESLQNDCVKVYGELLSFTPDDKVITVKDNTTKVENKENEEYTEVYGELLIFDNDIVKITKFREIEPNINNMYECMICKKLYINKYYCITHMKSHESNLYKCDVCNKKFTHRNHLNQHINVHKAPTFECDICGIKMVYRFNMLKHRKTHIKYYKDGKVCYI